jgi:hypothetical protein
MSGQRRTGDVMLYAFYIIASLKRSRAAPGAAHLMQTPDQQLRTLRQELTDAGLTFAPGLTDQRLAAFEQAHHVALPPEYRLFLMQIGNGGAGPPAYGLRPLGAAESWWADEQRAAWQHFQLIQQPFPFEAPWFWEDEEEPDPVRLAAVYHGSLYLGTDGCGMDWALIVTGPQRGYVWQLTESGITPCRPARTFFGWISAWLHHDPTAAQPFGGSPKCCSGP